MMNMLALVLSINVMWLFFIAGISAFTGYIFRSSQIRKKQKHILFLESEMLRSHEEILKLQQELTKLDKEGNQPHKIRVIPIKDPKSESDITSNETAPKKKTNN
jgi:hypothetical protein